MTRLPRVLLIIALLAACGPATPPPTAPDLGSVPMDTPETRPLQGTEALLATLAEHGVAVGALDVHHAGETGTTYSFPVDAEESIATWARLRAAVAETGYYPVVSRDEHGMLEEQLEFNDAPLADTLRVAAKIDAEAWFGDRSADDPEYYGALEEGTWEDVEPQSGWALPFDVLTGDPAPGVRILLVPTTRPWEVLAHLRYGAWNECPAPEEHVAVQRSWFERFGAEIVCVGGDVVEMRVARPPADDDGALALAREQFVYSGGDLVYQGYGSLKALASGLRGADYWTFWWD